MIVTEGNPLNYTINGADVEVPADLPYIFSMQSTLNSIILEQLNTTTARIRFNNSGTDIATYADKGNYTVSVTIQDNGTTRGLSDPRNYTGSFLLSVVSTNLPANVTYQIMNSNNLSQFQSLLIYVNASDRENDTLSFYSSNSIYSIAETSNYSIGNTSYATAIINITNMSNNYVITQSFNITVNDGKQNTIVPIILNITNVNDPPQISEISYNPINTLGNTNISNLVAYGSALLTYKVNASDIDDLTYDAANTGIRNYSTNDPVNFPINVTSGILSFTLTQNGTYPFTVYVTDGAGITANRSAILNVITNNPPYFIYTPIIIYCNETDYYNWNHNCIFNLSKYANDSDIAYGDFIKTYWTNSSFFTINDSTGIVNFFADQSYVGTHSIMFNITDNRSATNSTLFSLIINNTNNPPNITLMTIIPSGNRSVGSTYVVVVNADDLDLNLPSSTESLSYSFNASGPDNSIFTPVVKNSENSAQFSFLASTSNQAGDYSVDIKVTDLAGNYSLRNFKFTIYNVSSIPIINNITPFGTPIFNNAINTSWERFDAFPGATNITIYENTTYIFNETSVANTSAFAGNFLNYSWMYDNTLISSSPSIILDRNNYFNFFSAGSHILEFSAIDAFNRSNTFTWNININDVNRRPILVNQLRDLIVNGSGTYYGYMIYDGTERFYDPDDDRDSDGIVDANETNTLIFESTFCPYANLTFAGTDGRDLYAKTLGIGECLVNFTAYDNLNSSMNVTAYNVLINVTYVSNETLEIIVPQPTISRSSSGSSTRTIAVPLPEEVDRPKPLQIITPKLVTVYKNSTVKVPLVLNNTWNGTLEGVTLRAYTNATNVTVYLDKIYFPRIDEGKIEDVTLIIGNYKSEGHYEIQIAANVTNPQYQDVATIFVNSADMQSEGDQLDSKISFARDLLSSNPECQELTELLNQAKKELALNHNEATARLVDDVINGCKYLLANSKQNVEKPSKDFVKMFNWNKNYNEYLIIAGFAILFVIALSYILKKE